MHSVCSEERKLAQSSKEVHRERLGVRFRILQGGKIISLETAPNSLRDLRCVHMAVKITPPPSSPKEDPFWNKVAFLDYLPSRTCFKVSSCCHFPPGLKKV
jgi:hypothetical protein